MHPDPAAPDRAAVRVLAIADTDSYHKWSAATLEALPDSWESTQVLVENPVMPSATQIRATCKRPVGVLTHAALVRLIRTWCPDVVLLACTGPVVATLTAQKVFWGRARPVLVAGLPGISVRATRRAVTSRAACDLFLLHSKREVAEFTEIGARRGHGSRSVWPRCLSCLLVHNRLQLRPNSGAIWCSLRRQRCQSSERTEKRSCWR